MFPVVVLLFETVLLGFVKAFSVTDVGNAVAFIMILLHVLSLVSFFSRDRRLRPHRNALTWSLLFRLFLLCVDLFAYPSFVLPHGHSDEDMFYWNAISQARYGTSGRGNFPKVMGTYMRVIGYNRLYIQYISMLFSIVALIYMIYAMHEIEISAPRKKKIVTIICLLPNFAILSSLFMREAIVTMFISVSAYYFVKWIKEKQERYYYIAAALVLPAASFHGGTIAVLVGYILLRLLYDNKHEVFKITTANIFLTVIVTFVAIYIVNRTGMLSEKFGNVDSLEDIAAINYTGDSSYARYVGNSNNPLNFIIYTPLRLVFFLFSPLPFQWRGAADLIAFFFSSMLYLATIWDVIRYLRKGGGGKKRYILSLFIVAIIVAFIFAWGTSNTGTATRHRDKMVTVYGLLLALSLDGLGRRSEDKYNRRYSKSYNEV